MAESGGTGNDPIFEWEHLGIVLPKGTELRNLNFVCRTNSTQIEDLEIIIVQRKPNTETGWKTGIDSDNEMDNTVIQRGFFRDFVGDFAGNTNDMHGAVIPLNFTLDNLSMVSIYIKPKEVNTITRYIYASWTWELI